MTKAKERLLRSLFTKWDRYTAYGCMIRQMPYNKVACEYAESEFRTEWNNPKGWDFNTSK